MTMFKNDLRRMYWDDLFIDYSGNFCTPFYRNSDLNSIKNIRLHNIDLNSLVQKVASLDKKQFLDYLTV